MLIQALTVVNQCLATKGIMPLETLEDDHPDRDAALMKLEEFNMNIQSHENGWWFNTEYIALQPEAITGHIFVPQDALECVPTHTRGFMVAQRGRRFYNSQANTYQFEKPLNVRIIRLLPFEELPYIAQYAVQTAVVADYQNNYDADRARMEDMSQKAMLAWARLKGQDLRQKRVNMMHTREMAAFMQLTRIGPSASIPLPTGE